MQANANIDTAADSSNSNATQMGIGFLDVNLSMNHYTLDAHIKLNLTDTLANTTIDYAVDHWADLDKMTVSERIKVLRGARFAERDAAARRGTGSTPPGTRRSPSPSSPA